ncbi:MAG: hypothetical protein ACK5DD_08480 [Cyclobacteriaceae bacterium]|jgi:hypothetical protein
MKKIFIGLLVFGALSTISFTFSAQQKQTTKSTVEVVTKTNSSPVGGLAVNKVTR